MRLNTVHTGDSTQLIKEVADQSIDLITLDPDYQNYPEYCKNGFIDDLRRVIKPTGTIVCFVQQPFDHNLRVHINDIFIWKMVWSYQPGAKFRPGCGLPTHNDIFILGNKKNYYLSPRTGLSYSSKTSDENKRTGRFGSGSKIDGIFRKHPEGTYIKDHYHYPRPTVDTNGIPVKPKDLINTLVRCLCPKGGIVLDPFSGSNIVGEVCIELGNNFLGFEINEDRVQAANSRLESSIILINN